MATKPTKHVAKNGDISWRTRIPLPPDPATGKRRQRWLTAPTKKELEALIAKTEHELNTGAYVEPSRLTVAGWLREWLGIVEIEIGPGTFANHYRHVHNRLIPDLGAVPLAELTPVHVQKAMASWSKLTRKEGDREVRLCSTTTRSYYVTLSAALKRAVALRLIPANPAAGVKAPPVAPPKTAAWTVEQTRHFLESTAGDRWAALWQVLLTTGMRKGELLALRWSDVDLEAGTLTVQRALKRGRDGRPFVGEPKTRSGRRVLSLLPSCVATLRAHRDRQRFERGGTETELVFCNPDGSYLSLSNVQWWWRQAVRRAGLPAIRIHDGRHSHGTHMAEQGTPLKVIQERLGHANASTTLQRYGHVTPTMQREAVARLEAALGG